MQTKIDLCAQALLKIGEQPITSFSENSAAAKIASGLYDLTIDVLLCTHPWKFAKQKYDLDKNTDGTFIIPSDVLHIVDCDAEYYEVIQKTLIADQDDVSITAIVRVNPDMFPAYFTSTAITKLAMEFCIPLTGNQNTFAILNAVFENELKSARFLDSVSASQKPIENFSLLSTRF